MRQPYLLKAGLPMAAALALLPCLRGQDPAVVPPDGKAEHAALAAEFKAAQATFDGKLRAAKSASARRRVQKKENPAPDFIPRFQEAAGKYAETAAAIPFLTWLLDANRTKENDVSRDALANLVVDHVKSPDLVDAVLKLQRGWTLVGKADAEDAFGEILANSPHKTVKAAVLYVRSMATIQGRGVSESQQNVAFDDLRKAVKMAPDAEFIAGAEGVLFENEHLQIGMKAPDIIGNDLDGQPFKLSDYKGKVIMLDFWGDW